MAIFTGSPEPPAGYTKRVHLVDRLLVFRSSARRKPPARDLTVEDGSTSRRRGRMGDDDVRSPMLIRSSAAPVRETTLPRPVLLPSPFSPPARKGARRVFLLRRVPSRRPRDPLALTTVSHPPSPGRRFALFPRSRGELTPSVQNG